jgi:hypothetical protein
MCTNCSQHLYVTGQLLLQSRFYCLVLSFRLLKRMAYSGMLRRVALVRTDVSEELSASFIRMTRIGELETTLAVTSNRPTLRRNTKRSIPEDAILHSHRRENLKSF